MPAHIGRLQAIGLGRETTPGTAAAVEIWIPKSKSTFKQNFEVAEDASAIGVIDAVADTQTVKTMTEVSIEGSIRDNLIGYLLLAAMGTSKPVVCATLSGVSGGTPARGDAVSSQSSGWSGRLEKIITIGGTARYFFSTDAGTLGDGSTDLTNGTWTATVAIDSGVKGHFFSRLNSNQHPSFTIYGDDPVSSSRAAYGMLSTLDLEVEVGNFARFVAAFRAKKIQDAGTLSPAQAEETPFLAKHATVSFADDESGLDGAATAALQRFKLSVEKNITDVQAFGSDDVTALHNQQLGLSGEFEALYDDVTYRDYVANSTKKAARMALVNTDSPALATGIYPGIYVDVMRAGFRQWETSDDADGLVRQTVGFTPEYKSADGSSLEMLLLNSNAAGY